MWAVQDTVHYTSVGTICDVARRIPSKNETNVAHSNIKQYKSCVSRAHLSSLRGNVCMAGNVPARRYNRDPNAIL